MNAAVTLARHSVRRSRSLLLVMAIVLAGFEVLLVLAARTLQELGTFSSFAAILPPFVRQMFGDSLLMFMSYTGLVAFGYFHPIIIAALVGLVITLATEPVADIETRFFDIVLARPVRRAAVVTRSVLLIVLVPAAVIAAMAASTVVAMHFLAPSRAGVPSPLLIVRLALNLWAVLLCVGGAGLAVAAAARRRGAAAGIVGIATLALFLLDFLARIWKPVASLSRASPFHYYDAMAMVMGRPLPAVHLAVLIGAGIGGFVVAFAVFSRRDL